MGAIMFKDKPYTGPSMAEDVVFDNSDTDLESTNVNDAIIEVYNKGGKTSTKTMTVKLNLSDSNPSTWATYEDDAENMLEGSDDWDAFFGHYPCLLQGGGETALLNRNNFAKDVDGNTVSTDGSAGDVMVAFPRRGIKITKANGYLTVSMTNEEGKSGYQYYAHTYKGDPCDKFYLGVYKGYYDGSKLRSASGKTITANQTITTFRNYAQANGSGYEQSGFYQLLFRQVMYLLKYKGQNAQSVIGKGYTKSSHSAAIQTGGSEAYGMDSEVIRSTNPSYMTDEEHHVKLFGLEDFYGNIHEWIDGLVSDASYNLLTNTGNVNFDTSGTGYTSTASGISSNINGYMTEPQGSSVTGFVAKAVGGSGSETTYFCDLANLYASCVAAFGGSWNYAGNAGVFRLAVSDGASVANASVTARLMFLHKKVSA